jgi:hypothetical protein
LVEDVGVLWKAKKEKLFAAEAVAIDERPVKSFIGAERDLQGLIVHIGSEPIQDKDLVGVLASDDKDLVV